ncbi:MAG: alkaline phosphatase family protein [Actinocatenispora sp.]
MSATVDATRPGGLLAPRYGSGSLADLLPSTLAALGVPGDDPLGLADGTLAGVRSAVVLLVDGLGYHQLRTAAPVAPGLAAALAGRAGVLSSLTSAFPSTTPTSLVTVGTGAPPGQHGVVGFTVLVPGTDRTITHITWDADVDPRRWQPLDTQFDRATAAGVAAVATGSPKFAESGLTVAAYRGAGYRGAQDVPETVAAVLAALREPGRSLVYAYHPDVDRVAHLDGPDSPEWLTEAAVADELITGIAAGLPADAALLVTADHGAVAVRDTDRIDIDGLPGLLAGTRVVTGEPRVRYVHVEPGATADILAAWQETLGDRALVLSRDEAVATGWYGPVTAAAAARIGDVVAVATGRHVLVRTGAEPYESGFRGYHGALTEAEVAVPLLVLRPGELTR